MPTYIVLTNLTPDGLEGIEALEPEDVVATTSEIFAEQGGELRDAYLTMGQYDGVAIAEFPDDQSCAEALLSLGATGVYETETLRAFPEDEIRDIVGAIGE